MEKLSKEEYKNLKTEFPYGMLAEDILNYLDSKGINLASVKNGKTVDPIHNFRKMVQLGILRRSTRFGPKGIHKGSQGRYPIQNIDLILRLRHGVRNRLFTIEELAKSPMIVGFKLEYLLDQIQALVNEVQAEKQLGETTDWFYTAVRKLLRSAYLISTQVKKMGVK